MARKVHEWFGRFMNGSGVVRNVPIYEVHKTYIIMNKDFPKLF